jgi:hypothetical protein
MNYHDYLGEKISQLSGSCSRYDEGYLVEAKNIAVALRVIFHQTASSTSLLTYLNSTSVKLLSTSDNPKGITRNSPAITTLKISPQQEYMDFSPKLGNFKVRQFFPFNYWWNEEGLYNVQAGKVTRRSLVLAVANKDGGAHIDTSFPADYQELLDGAGWGMTVNRPNGTTGKVKPEDANLSAIRQIAYEVLHSDELLLLASSRPPKRR